MEEADQAVSILMEGGPLMATPREEDQAGLTLQEEYMHLSDLLAETYGELYVLRFEGEDETLVELDAETESTLKQRAALLEAQLGDIEEEMMVL